MKKILFFYTFFAAITLFAQNVSLDLTAASGTYAVPQGVTSLTVEAWGGGGGGGGARASSLRTRSGSGGGGGSYARRVISPVTSTYNYWVGSAGAQGVYVNGAGGNGGNGGTTTFGSSTILNAPGGKGGKKNSEGGGAGGAGAIGGVFFDGGSGAKGDNDDNGGGGGSAGGGGKGGNANNTNGGAAGAAGAFSAGARGADGSGTGIFGSPGSNGDSPGAGGSGGKIVSALGTYDINGGAGAQGLIRVSFMKPAITISANTSLTICSGSSVTLTASSAGAYDYTWSNGQTGNSITVSPGTTTTYTVTGTASNGAGGTFTHTQTVIVTVNPMVSAGTISGTSPLFIGDVTTYSSNEAAGGTWSSSDVNVFIVDPSTGVVTAQGAGSATITYTVNSCGGPNSATATVVVTDVTTWYGAPDTGSWDHGVPTATKKAAIAGSYQTSEGGDFTAKDLTVNAEGSLLIEANGAVTVINEITNQGNGDNFVVESDGNLIQIEDEAVNSGSITAERYVTDMDNVLGTQLDYVYWSSPVTGQDLRAFSPGTRTNKIFYYNEPTDFFKAVNFATEPNFVPGKGYAFEAETTANGTHSPNATGYNETYKFKGTPNNGVISPDVQRSANTGSGGTVEHGYNLIGNPYPSNISFPEFYAMNSTKIYNTAWFWTNNLYTQNQQGSGYTPNNYAVWTGTGGAPATSTSPANGSGDTFKPDGIVAVGQGFIVQVRPEHIGAGTQQLIFKNKNTSNGNMVRVSTAGHFFNKNDEQKDRFWLKLISSDSIVNTQLIGYIEGATNDFEKDYDAEIMGMSSNIFYSTLEDRKLQIQGKAAFDTSDNVQLGANIFKNGTYTIAIENPEGIFNAGQKVYLKDNLLNRWVDLNSQTYTFEATKGLSEGRFEIVYESPTILGTDAVTKDELQVYRDSGDFVVKAKSKKITMLEVYDASGRLVYTAKPNDTKVLIGGDRLNSGVYILKINQDGVVTGKKILK